MGILSAIEIGLAILPKITVGVTEFIAWISKLREAAQQAEIWTEAYEAAWRAALLSHNILPEEKPDGE